MQAEKSRCGIKPRRMAHLRPKPWFNKKEKGEKHRIEDSLAVHVATIGGNAEGCGCKAQRAWAEMRCCIHTHQPCSHLHCSLAASKRGRASAGSRLQVSGSRGRERQAAAAECLPSFAFSDMGTERLDGEQAMRGRL